MGGRLEIKRWWAVCRDRHLIRRNEKKGSNEKKERKERKKGKERMDNRREKKSYVILSDDFMLEEFN